MGDHGPAGGLSHAELGRIVGALADRLAGALVQKIRQPRENALLFECRTPGETILLLLSVHPKYPRFVPLANRPRENIAAGAFCMLLRKRLVGGRIVECALDAADRLLTINVAKRDEDGLEEIWTVVGELIGAKGNVMLLDPDGRVVESLLPKRLAMRRLKPGDNYEPPTPPQSISGPDRPFDLADIGQQLEQTEEEFELAALNTRLATVLSRECRRTRKYMEKLETELAGLPDVDQLTRQAETLLACLHLVKKGQTSATLPNLYETNGEALEVTLNPARSPKENAEALFKTARRARRKAEGLRGRITEASTREKCLAEWKRLLNEATDLVALSEVEQAMRNAGLFDKQEQPAPVARTKKREEPGPQPFVAADGARIYVGRNARENEEITFHVGRGNDYWLHVDGAPGSHVVVKLPASGELASETLLDAASLAVLHSSIKSAGGGSVLYTRCKHVRRPKNAPTGQVHAGATKAIFVRLDDQRIARLYASRSGGERA